MAESTLNYVQYKHDKMDISPVQEVVLEPEPNIVQYRKVQKLIPYREVPERYFYRMCPVVIGKLSRSRLNQLTGGI